MSASSDLVEAPGPRIAARPHRFALGIAIAMLALNLVGFGPTLYLRAFLDEPPLPLYLYVHGAIGTVWFTLLVVQIGLIANRQTRLHRALGWAGAAIAVAVVVSGLYTSTNMVPRNAALGLTSAQDLRLYETVTAADIAGSVVFTALVLLAVVFRKRLGIHKRLMLLASLSILGPAVSRIASWAAPLPNPLIAVFGVAFVAAFIAHDVMERRRLHVATVLGLLFFYGMNIGMQLSGIGPQLVQQRLSH